VQGMVEQSIPAYADGRDGADLPKSRRTSPSRHQSNDDCTATDIPYVNGTGRCQLVK
jgi:hypothetical protein